MQRRLLRAGAVMAALLVGSAAQADWQFNMPKGVTDISQEVYGLHMLIFWVCVIIGIAVFGVMFYAMFKHRKSKGAVSANFHESTKVELAWTLIPAVVIFAIGVRATFTLADMYNVDNADMTVEITGYQWRWRYRYINEADPDAEVDYFSSLSTSRDEINNRLAKNENYLLEVDQPLVLPVGQKVRFVLTAADVIHSWWVPELAVKKDAIPGMANEAWTVINEPGTYRGQCTELCGRDHGFMPVVVEAVSQAEFDEWLAGKQEEARQVAELTNQEWTVEQLVERGRGVYQSACAACHQPDGSGIPGTFPAMTGSPIVTGDIQDHIDIVFHGKAGTAMQAFGDQLSPVDLAAVITFERNALGNSVGDMVEPIEILNLSAGE
jgi:cytochrome c oxidase subunit 2